jgi:hypothetical protein
LAQGRENAKLALRENPEQCLRIENAIRQAAGLRKLKAGSAFDLEEEEELDELEIADADDL